MTSESWDVAVVGAGPVGLLLAGELAARRVRVVVLERAESRTQASRANGIVGRSAVQLSKRGILTGTGLKVRSPSRFPFGPLQLNLGFGPRNPLHVLPVPQHCLEEILENRAGRHGVEIRRGTEVTGFTQDDAGVRVEVRHDGTLTHVPAAFLVGCDGARSSVRRQAGIGFPGSTSDEIARIARVALPADLVTRTRNSCDVKGFGSFALIMRKHFPDGSFTIVPASLLDRAAPEDLYLISTFEPRGDAAPSDSMPVGELRASLRRVIGADLPFTDATDLRSTVANSRQADAYRLGRVFLAGDAAHIFDAGGSALNVGLQDAFDLAPRLCAVLRGEADLDDLDAYEAVRRPAGEAALRHTRAQAALTRDDPRSRALREVLEPVLHRHGAARALARLIENA